jgi:hypothetical protein
MAEMKLYYSPASPYARKVRVVAMETRLDRKMEIVNVAVSPVVGRHRFEAARNCGHQTIRAEVYDSLSDDEAELIQIDENLIRANLSDAERILHVARRKELYENDQLITCATPPDDDRFQQASRRRCRASGRIASHSPPPPAALRGARSGASARQGAASGRSGAKWARSPRCHRHGLLAPSPPAAAPRSAS